MEYTISSCELAFGRTGCLVRKWWRKETVFSHLVELIIGCQTSAPLSCLSYIPLFYMKHLIKYSFRCWRAAAVSGSKIKFSHVLKRKCSHWMFYGLSVGFRKLQIVYLEKNRQMKICFLWLQIVFTFCLHWVLTFVISAFLWQVGQTLPECLNQCLLSSTP